MIFVAENSDISYPQSIFPGQSSKKLSWKAYDAILFPLIVYCLIV